MFFSMCYLILACIVILHHRTVEFLLLISLMCRLLQSSPLYSFGCQNIYFLWFLFQGLTLKPVNEWVGQKLVCVADKDKIWSANHMANLSTGLNTCILPLWRLLVSWITKMFALSHSKLQDGNTEMTEESY